MWLYYVGPWTHPGVEAAAVGTAGYCSTGESRVSAGIIKHWIENDETQNNRKAKQQNMLYLSENENALHFADTAWAIAIQRGSLATAIRKTLRLELNEWLTWLTAWYIVCFLYGFLSNGTPKPVG